MPELDYAGIIQAGQGLVGDLQAQMFAHDQRRQQQQVQALKIQQAQQAQRRQGMFQQDIASAVNSGDTQAIGKLMLAYPEFADQIKPGWDALSEDARRRNLTQTGTVFIRAKNGDAKGAAALLRQRYDADVAAGQADETTKELIDAFDSGDPAQIQQATATVGMLLAAHDPAKFGETYSKVFPTDGTTNVQKEYQWRVGQFGQAAADQWLAVQDTKLVPVQAGGAVYNAADLVGGSGGPQVSLTQGGGDPTTGGQGVAPTGKAIESAALQAVPGLTVTSRQRSPGKNAAVGGVPNSYHLTDQARDFVPPKGMGMGALAGRLKKALPGFDVINEGDHVHVEPAPGAAKAGGPVKVRSKQEYDRLPKGAEYIAPDGSHRRKN